MVQDTEQCDAATDQDGPHHRLLLDPPDLFRAVYEMIDPRCEHQQGELEPSDRDPTRLRVGRVANAVGVHKDRAGDEERRYCAEREYLLPAHDDAIPNG